MLLPRVTNKAWAATALLVNTFDCIGNGVQPGSQGRKGCAWGGKGEMFT